jgi:GntR family transcriptional regulator
VRIVEAPSVGIQSEDGVALSVKRPLHRALYLQVRDALAERIASGGWTPGMAIANENDLARELGVSAGTVRKALELMEAQRLIARRQGHGTFVRDQASDDLAARFCRLRAPGGEGLFNRSVVAEISRGVTSEEERRRLNLGPGEAVYRMQRVRHYRGQPVMVRRAVVPAALFPDLAQRRGAAVSVTSLAQAFGILVGKGEERISICLAPEGVAQALGVTEGTPVMCLERIVLMLEGPPLEWSTAHCHVPGGHYLAEFG